MKNVRRIPPKQSVAAADESSNVAHSDTESDVLETPSGNTNSANSANSTNSADFTDSLTKDAETAKTSQTSKSKSVKKGKAKSGANSNSKKIKAVLDGSVLLKDGLQKYQVFILVVFALCFLLITSNYFTESVAREINSLKREVKELRFKQLSTTAERMNLSRQSTVAKLLDTVGIKESVVPPVKLRKDSK